MTPDQTRALLTVALMAAFNDGLKDERERAHVKSIAAKLPGHGIDTVGVYQDVSLGKPDLATVARPLAADPRLAQYAYEVAVGVVDADGVHTPSEGAFLEALAAVLGLPPTSTHAYLSQADSVAAAPAVPSATGSDEPVRTGNAGSADVAALDKRIVDAAVTNAALELLPETLASMAILPLQVRLVYQIGQAHGYQLDQGHIKEFVATLGIGLTGQYLEQFGRKLLGGLLGSVLGGLGGTAGRQAASSGMAFATTWALGQLAKQYYGSGRTLDAAKLKAAFSGLLEEGREMMPVMPRPSRSAPARSTSRSFRS